MDKSPAQANSTIKTQPAMDKSQVETTSTTKTQPAMDKSQVETTSTTKTQPAMDKSQVETTSTTKTQPAMDKSQVEKTSTTKTQPAMDKSLVETTSTTKTQPAMDKSLVETTSTTKTQPAMDKSQVETTSTTKTQPAMDKSQVETTSTTKTQPAMDKSQVETTSTTKTQPAMDKSLVETTSTTKTQPAMDKSLVETTSTTKTQPAMDKSQVETTSTTKTQPAIDKPSSQTTSTTKTQQSMDKSQVDTSSTTRTQPTIDKPPSKTTSTTKTQPTLDKSQIQTAPTTKSEPSVVKSVVQTTTTIKTQPTPTTKSPPSSTTNQASINKITTKPFSTDNTSPKQEVVNNAPKPASLEKTTHLASTAEKQPTVQQTAEATSAAANPSTTGNGVESASTATKSASEEKITLQSSTNKPSIKPSNTDNVGATSHFKIQTTNEAPSNKVTNNASPDKTGVPVVNADTEKTAKVKVTIGRCSFAELPPLPKKIVRIFVSSTFTDTKEERNALMQYVYPKLSTFCREKHGLEFQVVDMRWGVPQAASDNHSTTELCIQEIKKCQEVSVGPNFVAIVGDKYGYRPIPSNIEKSLFEKLKANFSDENSSEKCDWSVVQEWYQKDDNAVPPVYILQPISAKIPHYSDNENTELKKEAYNQWNTVNQILTATLRLAAERAFTSQQLTQDEKHKFFLSVTENEIQEGLFQGKNMAEHSCYCIIRKISDLKENITDPQAKRFADVKDEEFDTEARDLLTKLKETKLSGKVPESNLSKVDIEWNASGAKVSIDKFLDVDIAKYVQESLHYQEGQVLKYKTYLENVCTSFFSRVSQLIDEGGMKERQLYDELTSEILQHWHLAKLRCDVFEGRDDVLSLGENYLKGETIKPLTIYGNSGCGKTSVMAKILENVANGKWKSKSGNLYVIVTRFLGTTPNTSNVHQLIVTICQQIAIIYGVEWVEPEKFSELVKSFHKLLDKASEDKPLLLMLDSIDQLMPAYNAFKLNWLPQTLTKHVKLIISTINEGYPILKNTVERYGPEMKQVEVKPLGEKLGLEVINKWLLKEGRKMTDQQTGIIKQALQKCSLPLYARIAYDHIKKWKSYDIPKVDELEKTVRGSINKLFESLEEKFGIHIVKHSLSYLTACRYGLSEAELEHLLSLDDRLLNTVFMYWNPPIRRIPPLLWTRIRTEIHSYLVERSADDTLVLYWYHRQFIEATKERYLKDQDYSKYIHLNLTEYFTGKWGGGKEKPFEYAEAQMKRFGYKSQQSKADRKVPVQPYIIQNTNHETRYNKRKLSELPFHLIKCKDYKELKKQVFFNYEWLYAKLCSSSAQQLLEEFEIFMQADKIMKKDVEMKNLYVNLQLIRPYISRYPNSLAYELSGRLAKYIGQSAAITALVEGCDTIGRKHCPVVPLVTSFETADVGLTQNITFRKSEPWQEGGVFTCTPDFKTMYIIDYDEKGLPMVLVWDVLTAEKINSFYITKVREENVKNAVDVYVQAELTKKGTYLLGFYRHKYVEGYIHRFRNYGLVDMIDLENGNVLRTYEGFLYREDYYNPLQYLTENHLCVRFGWKVPLYNISEDTKKDINRPTLLSPDEKYFIMCGQKKTELKEFASSQVIGEFDTSETQLAIAAAKDFSIVAMMGSETKQLKIFDLGKKQLHTNKKYGYLLKYKKSFELEPKVASTVADLFKPVVQTNEKGEKEEKTNNRVVMNVASDDRHLLVVFRGTEAWVGYIWNMGRWNAKFVGAITDKMSLKGRYPLFNYDGTCVAYSKDKDILIYATEDGQQMNKYEMADTVKDFYMSQTSNKIAVMQPKSVVLLNIAKSEALITSKGKSKILNKTSSVLIAREINTSFIHKEVIITQQPGGDNVELEELEDIGMAASTDRLASARSKVRYAIDKQVTPNGLRVIHYHTRVQVIDTKLEQIVYTPKKGEHILRVSQTSSGPSTNETVKIPGLEPGDKGPRILDLLQGDRIVNENNKVKFRVNQEPNGQFKIMNVPSIITVYSAEEEKLRRLQRITVYQEYILTLSNNYCVTSKKTISGNFIKIYELNTGKDLATHEVTDGADCAKFSFDEAQLFVVDRSLTIRVYLAPSYNSLEQKIQLQTGQISTAFVVKDILTFEKNRDLIVVRYGPGGDSSSVRSRYIHVNLATKEKSQEMEMRPCFEDISKDGEIGVDARLCVYKLNEAKVANELQYAGIDKNTTDHVPQGQDNLFLRKLRYNDPTATMQLRVRISEDSKYIVYVDKQDDTLHIAEMMQGQFTHLLSCHTHVPNLSLSHGIEVRYYGRIIMLRTGNSITAFAIMDSNSGREETHLSYASEMSRALSIVDNVWANCTQQKLPNKERDAANQVFLRKYALREEDEEEDDTDVNEEEQEKEKLLRMKSSTKPSVLILGESLLSQFKASRFTAHLSTQLYDVANVDDAIKKLKALPNNYDAIVLQLITDDVKYFDAKTCIEKISSCVEFAKKKSLKTVLCSATHRADNQELNQKTEEINQKIKAQCIDAKGTVVFCDHSNMSESGKPINKYFKDGVHLSPEGIKQISINIKNVLQKVFEMDII